MNDSSTVLKSLDVIIRDSIDTQGRTTLNIIWSSLTTIFACTWLAWHPNIPGLNETWFRKQSKQIMAFLVALLMPEVVLMLAIRQLFAARRLGQKLEKSTTHGFFVLMGGIVMTDTDGSNPRIWYPVEKAWLGNLYTQEIKGSGQISQLHKEDIEDKSKQDWLAKSFVLIQIGWFIAQFVARKVEGMAPTELELTASAYALLSLATYVFWWYKPFRVDRPICKVRNRGEKFLPSPREDIPASFLDTIHRLRYILFCVYTDSTIPFNSLSFVPTFYSGGDIESPNIIVVAEIGIAALFGGIHLFAWDYNFPTIIERIIWRVSALSVTAIPVVGAILCEAISKMRLFYLEVESIAFLFFLLLYIISRFLLLALAFSSLRSLPPSALAVVDWTTFIPHIS